MPRAGAGRQRARADEAQAPAQDGDQQRQFARADAFEPTAERPAGQRPEAREHDRPSVAPEPDTLLQPALAGAEREHRDDKEEQRQQRGEHREREQHVERPLGGERGAGARTREPLSGSLDIR